MFGTLYESDHTIWMREMLEKNPQWAQEQKTGRAIWWDKQPNPEAARRYAESTETVKAYTYDVNFEF